MAEISHPALAENHQLAFLKVSILSFPKVRGFLI